jgi:hypothetical protein
MHAKLRISFIIVNASSAKSKKLWVFPRSFIGLVECERDNAGVALKLHFNSTLLLNTKAVNKSSRQLPLRTS